ncbi:VOC family protein [Streptomyces sp. NPDC060194]|uniref:VOC family protein n=1 Tax=Streptomyces sp. NPDC060194 TaxID=3347069 RepID=UPI00366A21F1
MAAAPTPPVSSAPPGPFPLGAPCWVDAVFPDAEGAKRFYGDLLGWTFTEPSEDYGGYAQALVDGRPAAAIVPPMPGQEDPPIAWNLYFASPDIEATAARIREHGGTVTMDPMPVGEFGSMLVAQDPGGVWFSVWQAGKHPGFTLPPETPGMFCWAEVTTRQHEEADRFFSAVFDYEVQRMEDDTVDFTIWTVPGSRSGPAAGRLRIDERMPDDLPAHVNVYFTVLDLDPALETVARHGGTVVVGPEQSPFGRFATIHDPWGATLTLIDTSRTEGDMPAFT